MENANIHQEDLHKRKESVLQKCLLGNKDEEFKWKKELKGIGIEPISDYYLMGCVHLQMNHESDLENFLNWENVMISMLKDTIRVNGIYEVFRDFQNNIIFIINFENEQEQMRYKAYELLDFPKIIDRRLGMECQICFGDYCKNDGELGKEYYRIQKAIKNSSGEKIIKLFEESKKYDVLDETGYRPQFLAELNEALANKEIEKFGELWSEEWENAFQYGDETAKLQLFATLLALLLTDIVNSGRSIESVYGEEFRPHNELYMILDLEERVKKLFFYYECWIKKETQKNKSHSKIIAEKARNYIQAHYMEGDLNVADISRELFINQTYLRKMFKEEMGMTLLEFITKYRMHMAKQLILNTEYSLTQIAEQVGYNDVGYFSKCFKKYYQVSPKQMTKRHYQSVD